MKEFSEYTSDMHEFNKKNRGIAFTLLMDEDGKLKYYERINQPCFGELRPYNFKLDGIRRPSDLSCPFPKGNPVAVGINTVNSVSSQNLLEWCLSEKSPWRSCLTGLEVTRKNEKITGFVLTDTRFDPTVLLNLLLTASRISSYFFDKTVKDFSPEISFLLLLNTSMVSDYAFLPKIDIRRFREGDPLDLTTNERMAKANKSRWFSDRAAYNRPEVAGIFAGEKSKSIRQLTGDRSFTVENFPKTAEKIQELLNL